MLERSCKTLWFFITATLANEGFLPNGRLSLGSVKQLNKGQADLDMTFESFVQTYTADMQSRIKENTWETKEHIIHTKLLPYFGKRKICDIQPKEIIAWQNEMINYRDANSKAYSCVLKYRRGRYRRRFHADEGTLTDRPFVTRLKVRFVKHLIAHGAIGFYCGF